MQTDRVGRIELVPDDDGRGGVTVMMDGSPQSHVDLADPSTDEGVARAVKNLR